MPPAERELHDLEAEQYLLWCLVYHERRHELRSQIFPSLFYSPEHRDIFNAIAQLGDSVDILGVCRVVEKKHGIAIPTTAMLFMGLDYYLASNANPEQLIRYLKKLLYQRSVVEKAKKIASLAEQPEQLETIATEVDKITILERTLLRSGPSSMKSVAEDTANKVNTDADVIVTGHDFINRRLYGLTRGSLSGLLARPGHMKSSYTDHLMSSSVRLFAYRGLIISLEDNKIDRIKRIIAPFLGISLTDMKFKRIKVTTKDILSVLEGNLHSKLTILDSYDILTPDEAYAAIMDIKPDFVVVDHIQEFEMKDMVTEMIQAVRKLKTAAVRCNAHILITSQVTDKGFKGRDNPQPKADDAMWTSAIRQSSSEMFSLYYPYQDNNNEFNDHILKFAFLKSRFAQAIGTVTLHINPDQSLIIGEFGVDT